MERSDDQALQTLVRIVAEDAGAVCRREEDRARNESRRLVREAQDRIDALRRAAHALGRTRGEAADAAEAARADAEVEHVHAGALEALSERFRARLLLRLQALPDDEVRYPAALAHWAREAAAALDGPVDVSAARRDRAAVYAALLAAGAADFQVQVDHAIHVGFVVRDLDGRTVLDRRPKALIDAHAQGLRDLLQRHVQPFAPPPQGHPTEAAPSS